MRAFIFSAMALALFVSAPISAQEVTPDATYGICLDFTSFADAWYFTANSVNKDTYQLTGYNYSGAVHPNEHAVGTLRVNDGMAYIAIMGGNISDWVDFNQAFTDNAQVDLASWTGSVEFHYSYMSGGLPSAHGGGDGVILYLCAEPLATPDRVGPAAGDPSGK